MGMMKLDVLTQPLPHVKRRGGRPAKRKSALEHQPPDDAPQAKTQKKKARSKHCTVQLLRLSTEERRGAARRAAARRATAVRAPA